MSEDAKLTIGQLEQRLLDREIEEICKGIDKVGKALSLVFAKYSPMDGHFAEELQKFLSEKLRLASSNYSMGRDETYVTAYVCKSDFPDELKRAILDFTTKDFLDKIDQAELEIEEIRDILPC